MKQKFFFCFIILWKRFCDLLHTSDEALKILFPRCASLINWIILYIISRIQTADELYCDQRLVTATRDPRGWIPDQHRSNLIGTVSWRCIRPLSNHQIFSLWYAKSYFHENQWFCTQDFVFFSLGKCWSCTSKIVERTNRIWLENVLPTLAHVPSATEMKYISSLFQLS